MLPQLLVNGLIAGSIYALVALGFGLIYPTTRFFHFAHGAVYTAGDELLIRELRPNFWPVTAFERSFSKAKAILSYLWTWD